MRLLISMAALGQGEYLLTGTPRMQERPDGRMLLCEYIQFACELSRIEAELPGRVTAVVDNDGLPRGQSIHDLPGEAADDLAGVVEVPQTVPDVDHASGGGSAELVECLDNGNAQSPSAGPDGGEQDDRHPDDEGAPVPLR